jgi:hypothetical protein
MRCQQEGEDSYIHMVVEVSACEIEGAIPSAKERNMETIEEFGNRDSAASVRLTSHRLFNLHN